MTVDLWVGHLKGEIGVGCFPLRDDGRCRWGVIDVDRYDVDLVKIAKEVVKLQLPLIVCRSKSGGAHIFLFLREWVDAKIVRGKLMEWAVALGYGGVEVFPKQTRLASTRDFGNWLNMPYFNAERSMRYGIRPKTGDALSAEEFLDTVEQIATDEQAIVSIEVKIAPELEGGPPCLQVLSRSGFPEGTRNQALFNIGVYLKKRYGEENVADHLDNMNQAYMKPPLGHEDVSKVLKSVLKKNYSFRCKEQPISAVCNRQICLTRAYGVGRESSSDPGIEVGQITKLLTDPPVWIVEVNSMRIEMDTDTLMNQRLFSRIAMEKLNVVTSLIKDFDWRETIRKKMTEVEEIAAPEDASDAGTLLLHVQEFCTLDRQTARSRDELLLGKPWISEGRVFFRSVDLQKFLTIQRLSHRWPSSSLYQALRSHGAQHHQFNVKGKNVQCWSLPAFAELQEPLDPVPLPVAPKF